jgi:hypothetical protein
MITITCDFCGKEIKITEVKDSPDDWTWHTFINRNGCLFEYRTGKSKKHICESCALKIIKKEAEKL